MTDDRRDNQDNQETPEGADDAEFGMMTFIQPGQQPMSLDELRAQQEQDDADYEEHCRAVREDIAAMTTKSNEGENEE